eukprot:1033876-Rhodomonas_salina.2
MPIHYALSYAMSGISKPPEPVLRDYRHTLLRVVLRPRRYILVLSLMRYRLVLPPMRSEDRSMPYRYRLVLRPKRYEHRSRYGTSGTEIAVWGGGGGGERGSDQGSQGTSLHPPYALPSTDVAYDAIASFVFPTRCPVLT